MLLQPLNEVLDDLDLPTHVVATEYYRLDLIFPNHMEALLAKCYLEVMPVA